MNSAYIPIKIIPLMVDDSESICMYLSQDLSSKLGISETNTFVSLGRVKKEVAVQIVEMDPDCIIFSRLLMNEIFLPVQSYNLKGKYCHLDRTLMLGPVIALLAEFKSGLEGLDEPVLKSIGGFCNELHQGFQINGGLFYIFSLQTHYEDYIEGFHFTKDSWSCSKLPFPDVVHNRIPSRKTERSPAFTRFINDLKTFGIPFFNDRFLSKWDVSVKLSEEKLLLPHLPETQLFSRTALEKMAIKYEELFIKPVNGSQGRNIIKLLKLGKGYQLQHSSHSPFSKVLTAFDRLFSELKGYIGTRPYLIQEGIPLACFDSRPLDFRVLCHRNKYSIWKATSIIARIGAKEQFVSNLAMGGETQKPIKVLEACFGKEKAALLFHDIKKLALESAEILSVRTEGITGELGADIGVDELGKPWIIEINSKPSKNFEPYGDKIRPSARALIDFCSKLAFETIEEKEDESHAGSRFDDVNR